MFYCNHEGWGKSFTNKHSLKRHKTTHDPNKKFCCDVCSKSFSLPQYLKEHRVVHTGERPFSWKFPGCNKSFRQAGKLSIHRKEHTAHKDETKFQIKVDQSFPAQNFDFYPNCPVQNLSETCDIAHFLYQNYCLCDDPHMLQVVVCMMRAAPVY